MNKLKIIFNLAYSAAVMIFALFVVYILIGSRNLSIREKAEFDNTPNCTSIPVPASTGQPCTFETVRVIEKERMGGSGKHSPDYYVDLQTASGTFPTAEVDEPFYATVSRADVMTAMVWHRNIVSLIYQGKAIQTRKNPDLLADNGFPFAIVMAVGGAMVLEFCFGLNFWINWKSLTAQR